MNNRVTLNTLVVDDSTMKGATGPVTGANIVAQPVVRHPRTGKPADFLFTDQTTPERVIANAITGYFIGTNGTYVDGTRIALLSDSFLCALRDLRDIEGDDLVARITAALADAIATYTSCSWPAAATHARRVLPSIKTSLISRVEYRQRTGK